MTTQDRLKVDTEYAFPFNDSLVEGVMVRHVFRSDGRRTTQFYECNNWSSAERLCAALNETASEKEYIKERFPHLVGDK